MIAGALMARLVVPGVESGETASVLAAHDHVEDEYAKASADLLAALESREDELSPETLREIRQNLAVIDNALDRTRAALENDPTNLQLSETHVAMHQRKVSMLQVAAWLPADASVRAEGE